MKHGEDGRYIPTLGGALLDDEAEVAKSLTEDKTRSREAAARDEADRYQRDHLCNTCFHAPVCGVSLAAQTMAALSGVDVERSPGLVWIGRCAHYTELPEVPEPEPRSGPLDGGSSK